MQSYLVPVLKNPVSLSVQVPGSKSISNRAFLLAALASGKSILKNILHSDDTKYMKAALQDLGMNIEEPDTTTTIVHGCGGDFAPGERTLFLGNAGTATRFLSAAMAIRKDLSIIDGNSRMRERPIKDLISGLRDLGVEVESETGCPPLYIRGTSNFSELIRMSGAHSSQYFSAMLQIAPCLPKGLIIEVEGDLVSKPYIDITLDVMKTFGVEVENQNYQRFIVKPQVYQAREYAIEGDASSASYWFALAAVTGSTVTVSNVSNMSKQGDAHFVDVLEKMGCHVERDGEGITVTGPKQLKALGEINMNAMPDVAMTLAVIAATADGETKIVDVANMRIKETDRIHALVTEMRKMGIECEELPDGLIVQGSPHRHAATIDTYDDHRMAMCFAVLGAVTSGVIINDPECTSKTYPSFFEEWDKILA